MELLISDFPPTVVLAAVAALGYLFGRGNAKRIKAERSEIDREMKKAKAVAREMERIVQRVRRQLTTHHAKVMGFKNRVADLSHSPDAVVFRQLCEETERMLKPTMRVVTQIAAAHDELRHYTTHLMTFSEVRTDPVTGLGNRRCLDETLEHAFAVTSRFPRKVSLAIFDIDHFKTVNDEHGHVYGDRVLKSVARVIDKNTRDTDTAIRYGGEEFVLILPGTDLRNASVLADRLRRELERADDIPVTISGGVAQAREDDTPRTLVSRADSALYKAKSAGRNCIFQHTGSRFRPFAFREDQTASAEPTTTPGVAPPADTPAPTATRAPDPPILLPEETTAFPVTQLDTVPSDAVC